jgi:hypothetical protein
MKVDYNNENDFIDSDDSDEAKKKIDTDGD